MKLEGKKYNFAFYQYDLKFEVNNQYIVSNSFCPHVHVSSYFNIQNNVLNEYVRQGMT